MRKLQIAIICLAVVAAPNSAFAMTGNTHDNTQDRFFRCDVIQNLYHVISTGRWVFFC